ncbi:unnamed protein product [Rotaria sp. Silwood1]|nr:unnamed protein product [Rotaria sp. Silwood1]CAF4561399.1 unnamed protein product [Rotaria sp. Silwood1]CAF4699002.1 unnamed protein product [Rotaria sp. Silwood1]
MSAASEKFHFVLSHELEDRIQIKISSIDGERTQQQQQQQQQAQQPINDIFFSNSSSFIRNLSDTKRSEPYVLCQVYSDGQSLCMPVQTSFKSFTDKWNWNEWLTLPLRYCDLPRHAILALSIHEIISPTQVRIIGSTTISLFDSDGTFRRGIYDLKVWPNVPPDVKFNSSTPGKVESILNNEQILSNHTNQKIKPVASVPTITTSNLQYNRKQITSKPLNITWNDDSAYPMLDELSRIAKLIKTQCDGHTINQEWLDQLTLAKTRTCLDKERSNSRSMLLMIEFARTIINDNECIILYFEPKCDDVLNYPIGYTDLVIYDPELDLENIVESKHLKLSRSARKALDKDLKPTIEQRDKLMQILAYPPGQYLSDDEQDLVWKYRFFLSQHNKALAKFLQCVHWDKEEEVKQALDLLQQWVTMDTEDALELLGPAYHHPKVRSYAVSRLRQAPDEDLLLYLLQLVQALRYERYDLNNTSMVDSVTEELTSSNGTYESFANAIGQSDSTYSDPTKSSSLEVDLSTFLIQRACEKPVVANYLFWYAYVECENNSSSKDKAISDIYQAFVKRLSMTLKTVNEQTQQVRLSIEAQKKFVDKLVELTNIVKRVQGSAKIKEDKLRSLLLAGDDSPVKFNFLNFDPIPLPLDPEVKIRRIIPDKIKIFKSAKLPFLFVCETIDGGEYPFIFKNGDDLRQDQLILQIIMLMDRILRKENIDLKLTPYKVLSTSLKYGFVQFIDSQPLRKVLERNRTIRQYLQTKAPITNSDDTTQNEIGIPHDVMDAYVKSCAGYCVVTYLLGVGDRHLDNLLLRDSGQLFHIDFGFIMGRDPKPLPQAMRVSKDMMEMLDDKRFLDFLRHCFTAFIILRKHANVFANLFSLMLDANIPDIALERDKTVKKLLDKFRLDLDDEKAISYLKDLIDSSIGAIVPQAKALSSSKVQLEDNAKDILELQRILTDLEQQKIEQYNLLRRALTEEDRRKHSQQTVTKEPSWTSLYSPNLQMAQYAHHPQHYLSAQQSHRLLAYKPPPPQPSQPPSFIPTTTSTNISTKRSRSPSSSHIYSSPSNKSSRSSLVPSMHTRPLSPNSTYSSSSSQPVVRNGAPSFPSPQSQSAFSAYLGYIPPSSGAPGPSASYPSPIPRVRPSSQMPNYLNQLQFLAQPIVDPKQQGANIYSHHPMLRPSKNGSIMNGYPLQPQQ